ncbi:MAG: hypothetical protein E7513_03685 [Ruminococcaceae bacterium]|nr:hypothetical protein [Oscillospiraceae bacterium]
MIKSIICKIRVLMALVLVILLMCLVITGCDEESQKVEDVSQTQAPSTIEEPTKEPTQVIADTSMYVNVIDDIISKDNGNEDCFSGMLYDLDNNGVEELIVVHSIPGYMGDETVSTFGIVVCSVYTIADGEAKCLLEEKEIYREIAGPDGDVSIIEKDGQTLMKIFMESGETSGPHMHRGGTHTYYAYSNDDFAVKNLVEYDYYTTDDSYEISYNESSGVIDGEDVSYYEVEEYVNDCEVLYKMKYVYPDRENEHLLLSLREELAE